MKVNQPFKLFVPTSINKSLLNYLEVNPPKFKYKACNFYFIVHYMLYKQMFAKKETEYFAFNNKFLRDIIGTKPDKYKTYLFNGEFILRDQYIPGQKPYWYKLNPKYKLDLNTIPVEPGTRLFEKMHIKFKNKKAHYDRLEPHLRKMKNKLMKISFDRKSALRFISNNSDMKKRLAYTMQIEYLENKQTRYFKRNKTNNRLDTNLTNLKSELRNFIVGDFTHIDLKNSQPFFLNQFIHYLVNMSPIENSTLICCDYLSFNLCKIFGIKVVKAVLKNHQKQKKSNLVNLKIFENAVNSGKLYDFIRERLNSQYARDEVKDMMFKVMFSQNIIYKNYRKTIPYENEKKVFANVFPFVAEVIKILKDKNHKVLPIFLTKIESYIFIDCISKKLVSAGIVPLTIHDSIIVETIHTSKAMEIIKNVFIEHFNVIPALHIKQMGTCNHFNGTSFKQHDLISTPMG
jgi:hypothetical protein